MTPTIWDSIANTSWWVFFLYLYFIYAGYAALHSRYIPYKSLRGVSIIFLITTVSCLFIAKQITLTTLGLWSAALAVGIILGWTQFWLMRIKADKKNGSLKIPGNWLILPFVFAAMYAQYRYNLMNMINLDFLRSQQFFKWLPPLYGLLAGLFIGKAIYSKRCLQKGPWVAS
jgi:hypothetical protein